MKPTVKTKAVAVVNAWSEFTKDPVNGIMMLASTMSELKKIIDDENTQENDRRQLVMFDEDKAPLFQEGQRIRLSKPCYWSYFLRRSSMTGTITGTRYHKENGVRIMYYNIRWDCYKRIFAFSHVDIDNYCEAL